MKEKIIKESIVSLRTEGLKFSVDILAERLKISKKTVYKYFPTKEDLARAIYEEYYKDALAKADSISKSDDVDKLYQLLFVYYRSKYMTRKELFNKYALNAAIQSFVEEKQRQIWAIMENALIGTQEEKEVVKIILDGTFEKLCFSMVPPKRVIKKLEAML